MKKIKIFFLLIFSFYKAFSSPNFSISGKLNFLKDGDTIELRTNKYGFVLGPIQRNSTVVRNGVFNFKNSIDSGVQYFTISFGRHIDRQFPSTIFFLEPGDIIQIINVDKHGNVEFSGKGSEKLRVINQLNQIYYNVGLPASPTSPDKIGLYWRKRDTLLQLQLNYINEHKTGLSKMAYNILLTNILSTYVTKYSIVAGRFSTIPKNELTSAITTIKKCIAEEPDNLIKQFNQLYSGTNPYLKYSSLFQGNVLLKYQFDSCVLRGEEFRFEKYYEFLKTRFSGDLQARLVTEAISQFVDYANQDVTNSLNDALGYVNNEDYVSILQIIKTNRLKGGIAFDFSLPDQNGNIHKLSDFKNKVVLIDFYTKNCGNCIKLSPYLAQFEEAYAGQPVVFISLNCDESKATWIYCLNSGKYTSNRALNLSTYGKGDKHPAVVNYAIRGYPTLVLIDKNGKVLDQPLDPRVDNGKDLKEKIDKAMSE